MNDGANDAALKNHSKTDKTHNKTSHKVFNAADYQ